MNVGSSRFWIGWVTKHGDKCARSTCRASALGKTANCQTLVSLTLARGEVPVMLALRLFLPESWTSNRARLDRAGVPAEYRTARTKPELALVEIDRAMAPAALAIVLPRAWIPFFASQGSNRRHHRRDMGFMFHAAHAPMKPVYALSGPRPPLWLDCSSANALSPKGQAGVEPVASLESKLRQDITPMPDADSLLGSVASEMVRYLASFAMTAVPTVVAVGVDSTVTIPNLSLVFVVPAIIAGVSLRVGSVTLFGDTWCSRLQFLPY